jgi:hypothetical protein
LVLECIMQESIISFTMQHWHVYRKWNERSFQESCRAYQQEREICNPTETWYQSQLDFFDNMVIPLARKLKETGVFGSYSDDYLNHAKKNREEWFRKGTTIVHPMEGNFAQKHNDKSSADAFTHWIATERCCRVCCYRTSSSRTQNASETDAILRLNCSELGRNSAAGWSGESPWTVRRGPQEGHFVEICGIKTASWLKLSLNSHHS